MHNQISLDNNTLGHDWVIGDIHGMYNETIKLLEYANFNQSTDRLFSTGDIIDRGPNSFETLHLLKEPWFFMTLGNHESFLLDYINNNSSFFWLSNGGEWHLNYNKNELADLILNPHNPTPLIYSINNLAHIVHAEILSDEFSITNEDITTFNFDQHRIDNLQWGRELYNYPSLFKQPFHPSTYNIFSGHTIPNNHQITQIHKQIYIDTGAFLAIHPTYPLKHLASLSLINLNTNIAFQIFPLTQQIISHNLNDILIKK
jgi:hypothetical protein